MTVPGFESLYEVSNYGQVRSLDRVDALGRAKAGRVLAPYALNKGHLSIGMSVDGRVRKMLVHRLVLMAFVGPCPPGMEACHNNGEPADNRLANLRWDSRRANSLDTVRHGTNRNAAKAACPLGHPYTADNTYVDPDGHRDCRICKRASNRAYKARHRDAVNAYRRARRATTRAA